MRPVVFTPLVASANLVEVSRFPRSIPDFLIARLLVREALFDAKQLPFLVHILPPLCSEHGFGSKVRIDRSLYLRHSKAEGYQRRREALAEVTRPHRAACEAAPNGPERQSRGGP